MAVWVSSAGCGEWLLAALAESEAAQAQWLEALGQFDAVQGWAVDGQLSCAEWLMWKARMSRSTAYERLQVAHALQRRSALLEAFRSGRISYSAVRAMARMDEPDPGVDAALIAVAEAGTVRDVERMVALYLRHAEQERDPERVWQRRGVTVVPRYDGTATIEITLEEVEAADFMAALEAFTADETESARADCPTDRPLTWSQMQADAAMEMVRTAVGHAGSGQATGEDRYLVHLVSDGEGMSLLDGTVLDRAAAARIACDSSSTTLLLGPDWEPLAMGRRNRQWTTAQRRAAMVRDGGRCRFPGCARRHADLHHHRWWSRQGPTDVANGYLLCPRHHTLVHSGWTVTGDPQRELTFVRPDGSVLGESRPRPRAV